MSENDAEDMSENDVDDDVDVDVDVRCAEDMSENDAEDMSENDDDDVDVDVRVLEGEVEEHPLQVKRQGQDDEAPEAEVQDRPRHQAQKDL